MEALRGNAHNLQGLHLNTIVVKFSLTFEDQEILKFCGETYE